MGSLNKYKGRITKPSQIFSVSFFKGPAVLVALFIVWDNVTCCNATEDQHHAVSYLHHGTVCFKCPPGTFRYRHCAINFTSPDCRPCPPQTFQSHHTQAGRCQPCLDQCLHDTNMVVVQACSGTSDLTCECTGGYYLYNDGYSHTCKKQTPCDSDHFTLHNGTSTSDFVCSMCPGKQFYKGQGQCVSCTSCAALNKPQLSPCTTDEDAACDVTQDMSVTEMTARNPHESNNILFITAGVSGVVMVIVLLMSLVFCLKRRKHTIALPHIAESPDPGKHDATSTSLPLLPPRPVSLSSPTSTCHHAQFPELADPNTWTKEVFLILSRTLTRNWKAFMRIYQEILPSMLVFTTSASRWNWMSRVSLSRCIKSCSGGRSPNMDQQFQWTASFIHFIKLVTVRIYKRKLYINVQNSLEVNPRRSQAISTIMTSW